MTPIDANDVDPLRGDNESMAIKREKVEPIFKYEGDAVTDGTMDMADFAHRDDWDLATKERKRGDDANS